MQAETGCDGLMISRGVQGNLAGNRPWRPLSGSPVPIPYVASGLVSCHHLSAGIGFRGEEQGIKRYEASGRYLKGFPGAARARQRINEITSQKDLYALLDAYETELK